MNLVVFQLNRRGKVHSPYERFILWHEREAVYLHMEQAGRKSNKEYETLKLYIEMQYLAM
jgi:hypothetical protein